MKAILFLILIFLIWSAFLARAVVIARRGHLAAAILLGIGITGFISPMLIPAMGPLLRYVELPTLFQTKTIELPDGRMYTATEPLARIQRYDAKGRFEFGWFVESGAGTFSIGSTKDGHIVAASARTDRAQIFTIDGAQVGPARPYREISSSMFSMDALTPSNIDVAGIILVEPKIKYYPRPSVYTLFLVPLWNPVVAWVLLVAGLCLPALVKAWRTWSSEPGTGQ